ncbi:hypothetical protein [Streptomyces sp. R44]|uniref:Uncharacterized protein n=1 Tax=Streptomyces sp. R44 TaxID=3238633 RepID=A0AB39T4R9_9ACTN
MPDELRDSEAGELLRAALSAGPGAGGDVVGQGEADALAAFRAARDSGLHATLHVREMDDWTAVVGERRPSRRPLKALVAALVASVTLGGVAFAVGGLPEDLLGTPAQAPEPRPTRSLPRPAPVPTEAGEEGRTNRPAPPGTTAPLRPEKDPPELPGHSRDALCHAFEKEGGPQGAHGKASKSAAWQRLVAAAGGEERVPAYCRYEPSPARTRSPAARPNEDAGRGAPSAAPGRGPERERPDRP